MELLSDLISVIVPVYNVEKYLERCLNSIIDQTYKNIEIICINDGSNDSCGDILKIYNKKDNRVKIIEQENQGLSSARNTGLVAAGGEYIFFVDSDDWLPLNALELLYKKIKKDNSDIVIGTIVKVYLNKSKKYVLKNLEEKIYSSEEYLKYSMKNKNFTANVVNKLYKTKIIRKYNICFEKEVLFEDFLFTIQYLIYSKKISILNNDIYYYCLTRKDSIVNKVTQKDLDALENISEIERFLKTENKSKLLEKEYFQNYIYEWILSATVSKLFKSGNIDKINEMYILIKENKNFQKYYKKYKKNIFINLKKIFGMIFYNSKIIFLLIVVLKNKLLILKNNCKIRKLF
ncbi:MAG: glycosyltransferase family 2 protein [Fusobacterium ulcerans]|uniref:glycosyltransferase family 2 protein n=1 Tax=Fusobacterium ulcerans TaxID=861 RepID=UPI003A88EAE2